MVSIKRSELESRVETATYLGFLVAIPAVIMTGGVAREFRDAESTALFCGALVLFALAFGTFKRSRHAATAQVVLYSLGASLFVYDDLRALGAGPHLPVVTLLIIGVGFLLVRGARATFALHGVKRVPIPRDSRYAFRPTSETVVIR